MTEGEMTSVVIMTAVLKKGEVVIRLNHHHGGDAEGHLRPRNTSVFSVRRKIGKGSIIRDIL